MTTVYLFPPLVLFGRGDGKQLKQVMLKRKRCRGVIH